MLLKYSLCVTLLFYNTTYSIAKTTIDHADSIKEGSEEKWILVGSPVVTSREDEENVCGDNEYEWTNGTCLVCLQHDDECETTLQCCDTDDMSCWQIGSNKPMCKCDRNYEWDKNKCVDTSVSAVFIVICVILGVAAIIAAVALTIALRKLWKGRRRQNVRVPREHHIIVPSAPSLEYSANHTEYEQNFGAPAIQNFTPVNTFYGENPKTTETPNEFQTATL